MNTYAWTRATVLLLLLFALIATGCATTSPPLSPAPVKPAEIPSPPVSADLPPSGSLWTKLCERRKRLREQLSLASPLPTACTAGPGS